MRSSRRRLDAAEGFVAQNGKPHTHIRLVPAVESHGQTVAMSGSIACPTAVVAAACMSRRGAAYLAARCSTDLRGQVNGNEARILKHKILACKVWTSHVIMPRNSEDSSDEARICQCGFS